MTIGFNTLFSQRDVRITPTSTATATAVGLTDPLYVTLATYADLVNERVLTAGDGIDFTDNGAGGTLVIAGELATTANKGIASFDASDFDTAAGVVTIDDSGVDHDATTNFAANEHFTEASITHTNITAGDGSDHSLLANKTSYLSIPGVAFQENSGLDNWGRNDAEGDFRVVTVAGDWWCWASVQIPQGAVVTGAIVYGADATNTWELFRKTLSGGAVASMATAAVNTEDTSIANATINNSTYAYQFQVTIGANDQIYGARIKYTTDYD